MLPAPNQILISHKIFKIPMPLTVLLKRSCALWLTGSRWYEVISVVTALVDGGGFR